jgi:hypothetical protein
VKGGEGVVESEVGGVKGGVGGGGVGVLPPPQTSPAIRRD